MKPAAILKIGIAIALLGLAIMIYEGPNLYKLAAACPIGEAKCSAFSNWEIVWKIGQILLGIGVITVLTGFLMRRAKK